MLLFKNIPLIGIYFVKYLNLLLYFFACFILRDGWAFICVKCKPRSLLVKECRPMRGMRDTPSTVGPSATLDFDEFVREVRTGGPVIYPRTRRN